MPHINVKINEFEGPFDLLFHLIEKNEMDIYNIQISILTSQYMEYISNISIKDMDSISEFLVMSATLLEIKSKMLLPGKAQQDEMEEDPRDILISMLVEYKRFKEVTQKLRKTENHSMFFCYKQPEHEIISVYSTKTVSPIEELLNDVTLNKLNEIFNDILRRQDLKTDKIRSNYGSIKKDLYTVEQKMEYIKDLIQLHKKVSFSKIFRNGALKEEVVITFWAVLELLKLKTILVTQETIFADITIQAIEDMKD